MADTTASETRQTPTVGNIFRRLYGFISSPKAEEQDTADITDEDAPDLQPPLDQTEMMRRTAAQVDAFSAAQDAKNLRIKVYQEKANIDFFISPANPDWGEMRERFREALAQDSIINVLERKEFGFTEEDIMLLLPPSTDGSILALQRKKVEEYQRNMNPGGRFAGQNNNIITKLTMLYFGLPVEPLTLNNCNGAGDDDGDDAADDPTEIPRVQRIVFAEKPLEFLDLYHERGFGFPMLRRPEPRQIPGANDLPILLPRTTRGGRLRERGILPHNHLRMRGGAGSTADLVRSHKANTSFQPRMRGGGNSSKQDGQDFWVYYSDDTVSTKIKLAEESKKDDPEDFKKKALFLLKLADADDWSFHIDQYRNQEDHKNDEFKGLVKSFTFRKETYKSTYRQYLKARLYNPLGDWPMFVRLDTTPAPDQIRINNCKEIKYKNTNYKPAKQTKPAITQPKQAITEPDTMQRTMTQPTIAQANMTQPSTVESPTTQPTTAHANTIQFSTTEAPTTQPTTAQPATAQPATAQSPTTQPSPQIEPEETKVPDTQPVPQKQQPTIIQPGLIQVRRVFRLDGKSATFENNPDSFRTAVEGLLPALAGNPFSISFYNNLGVIPRNVQVIKYTILYPIGPADDIYVRRVSPLFRISRGWSIVAHGALDRKPPRWPTQQPWEQTAVAEAQPVVPDRPTLYGRDGSMQGFADSFESFRGALQRLFPSPTASMMLDQYSNQLSRSEPIRHETSYFLVIKDLRSLWNTVVQPRTFGATRDGVFAVREQGVEIGDWIPDISQSTVYDPAHDPPPPRPNTGNTAPRLRPVNPLGTQPRLNKERYVRLQVKRAVPLPFNTWTQEENRLDKLRQQSYVRLQSVIEPGQKAAAPFFGLSRELALGVGSNFPTIYSQRITPTDIAQLLEENQFLRNDLLKRRDACDLCSTSFAAYEPEEKRAHYRQHQESLRNAGNCPICGNDRWVFMDVEQRKDHLFKHQQEYESETMKEFKKVLTCPVCDDPLYTESMEDIISHMVDHEPNSLPYCDRCGVNLNQLSVVEEIHHGHPKLGCLPNVGLDRASEIPEFCQRCGRNKTSLTGQQQLDHKSYCNQSANNFCKTCGFDLRLLAGDPGGAARHVKECRPFGGFRRKFCRRCGKNLQEMTAVERSAHDHECRVDEDALLTLRCNKQGNNATGAASQTTQSGQDDSKSALDVREKALSKREAGVATRLAALDAIEGANAGSSVDVAITVVQKEYEERLQAVIQREADVAKKAAALDLKKSGTSAIDKQTRKTTADLDAREKILSKREADLNAHKKTLSEKEADLAARESASNGEGQTAAAVAAVNKKAQDAAKLDACPYTGCTFTTEKLSTMTKKQFSRHMQHHLHHFQFQCPLDLETDAGTARCSELITLGGADAVFKAHYMHNRDLESSLSSLKNEFNETAQVENAVVGPPQSKETLTSLKKPKITKKHTQDETGNDLPAPKKPKPTTGSMEEALGIAALPATKPKSAPRTTRSKKVAINIENENEEETEDKEYEPARKKAKTAATKRTQAKKTPAKETATAKKAATKKLGKAGKTK